MTDQFISIEGGAYLDIRRALIQWMKMYAADLDPDSEFELFKQGRGRHFIRVDNRIDNEAFNYLMNYLTYPEGINYHITVEGFTTIRDQRVFPLEKMNTEILLFIPENDKEHDNVYAVTPANEVYKIDFGGKLKKVNLKKPFARPGFTPSLLSPPEILHPKRITGKTHPLKGKLKAAVGGTETDNPAKRFKLISLIILGLFLVCYLTLKERENFLGINNIIGGAAALWLFYDYKMLQNDNYYFYSVILALAIGLYGYYLIHHYPPVDHSGSYLVIMALPILFLVLQRPSRILFKAILKREPVVDKPAPSFADFIYMFFLWMALILIITVVRN